MFANFKSDETSAMRLTRTVADVLIPRGDEKNECRKSGWHSAHLQVQSPNFTSYRSNRFNNVFENPVVIAHHKDAIHFLLHRVSHSNKKLLSVVYNLQDKT